MRAPNKFFSIALKTLFINSRTTLILAILLTGCMGSTEKTKEFHYGQENAIWSESIYLRGYKPSTGKSLNEKDLKKYAKTLKTNNVKYAYLFAGPYQKDGHLPEYPFSDLAKRSVKKLKEYYPDIQVLPWIGGVQNKTVYLGDSLWRKNALRDTKRLVETLEIPGVHIDFEYILKGDAYLDTAIELEKPGDRENYADNVNSFHKELRELLPDSFISSVVVSTAPDTKPWKRKTTVDELKVLIQYVDQLSFLYYDTFINSEKTFEENCALQIKDIEVLKDLDTNTQFLLAIGTFVNRPELHKYRDLSIENIPNTLRVIKEATAKVNAKRQLVDGIAVFCDWETDPKEWKDISRGWTTNQSLR